MKNVFLSNFTNTKAKESHIHQCLSILFIFLKLSPVSFGGGFALLPILEKELVTKRKWLSSSDISDIFSLSQSAPGAIALNSAIYIGYRLQGILGAIFALIGICLPTIFIMIVLSITFSYYQSSPKIEAALQAIRTTVIALIVFAAYRMGKEAIIDKSTATIAVGTLILLYFFSSYIHPMLILLFGAISGIIVMFIKNKYFPQKEATKKEETPIIYDYMI